MRLSIAIQHHPHRSELLSGLVSALTPLPPQVIRDPEPDGPPCAWRTYRAALEATPAWASHRLIFQDDARLCREFPAVLERVVAASPDALIALCVCGNPSYATQQILRAADGGERWTNLRRFNFTPLVAALWPVRLIRPVLEWVDNQNWPRCVADDAVVYRALRALREEVWACVPSIVEHDDQVPSIARGGVRRGKARTAVLFAEDALDIVWHSRHSRQ